MCSLLGVAAELENGGMVAVAILEQGWHQTPRCGPCQGFPLQPLIRVQSQAQDPTAWTLSGMSRGSRDITAGEFI